MSKHPYSNEELNYFKFAVIVLNEFPSALRQIFIQMWNILAPPIGGQPWDDSPAIRKTLATNEGPNNKIPTNTSLEEWDCTAMFQATLFAKTFAISDTTGNKKTLCEKYTKNRIVAPRKFHSTVASPTGDPNETTALAIDQLRLLRNTLFHSNKPRVDKVTFDQYVKYAKEAFTAVKWSTTSIETIAKRDFDTIKVAQLNERIKKQRDDFELFLKSEVIGGLDDLKETAERTEKKMDELLKNSTSGQTAMPFDELEPESYESIDVLLLTINDVEFSEAYKTLSNPKSKQPAENQRQLCFGEIGRNNVALLKLSPTAIGVSGDHELMCAKTIQKLQPKAIVGLGVCSGTKKKVHGPGDILVSSQVTFYEPSSVNHDGSPNPFSPTFDCNLGLTRLFDRGKIGWRGPLQNVLVPDVHVGKVISCSQEMDRATLKEELNTLQSEVIGVDIEREGFNTICQNSGVPWVYCKSITSWVYGGNDSCMWHTFGAAASASYVEHVLKKFHIPEEMQAFENSLPKTFLPPMVPHFTGRQSECEEVVRQMTSQSTRLVTISGPSGFGKTSVAIAVGHRLKRQGLPVYFLSLRNVKSSNDLLYELLNSFNHCPLSGKEGPRSTDELCRLLAAIPSNIFIIIDDAAKLFESGGQDTSQGVLDLLKKVFSRCKNLTFLTCGTKTNLEFLKMNFQGRLESVNITPLDSQSSSRLVQELLPQANESDCSRIAKICGRVPLAMKLLCGLIGEDDEKPAQFLDEFCRSPENFLELLDNSNSASNLRLKIMLDSSFKSLSQNDKEAFVSLSVFVGEIFDESDAVEVIGGDKIMAEETLRCLQRKCLIDSTTSEAKLSFHPLVRSFADEKGRREMKEIACQANKRFLNHYVSKFKDLNQQFLSGNSLSAFSKFYDEKENFVHTLVNGISSGTAVDKIIDVLAMSDIFLDTIVYFDSESFFKDVYNTAIQKARGNVVATHQLLLGRAFGEITWGKNGLTSKLLKEAEKMEEENPTLIPHESKGKRMCYYGIYLLFNGEANSGTEILERGVSLMRPGNTILQYLSFQILAVFFKFTNDFEKSARFRELVLARCKDRGEMHLFFLALMEIGTEIEMDEKNTEELVRDSQDQPLILAFALLVSCLARSCRMDNIMERLGTIVSQIQAEIEVKAKCDYSYYPLLYYIDQTLIQRVFDMTPEEYREKQAETADILHNTGDKHSKMKDYVSALRSYQQALDIYLNLFGEEHLYTADCHYNIGVTHHEMKNYDSALQSYQQALNIRLKLFGEKHEDIVDIYFNIGVIQHEMEDYVAALQSKQKALKIKLKLFVEEQPAADTANNYSIANNYSNIGVTQHQMQDYDSALQAHRQALQLRLKLFGKEHPDIADSHHDIGVTQHAMKNYVAALESFQKALDIRLKLFGEKHADVAASHRDIGVTQHEMKDYTSALNSKQRALDIRFKLFGGEHQYTADIYQDIGVTQHELQYHVAASQAHQQALKIRLRLFGEEHPDTADSYREVGITQHERKNYAGALQSLQKALDIRLKLYAGERHAQVAESYRDIGITQYTSKDHTSALESLQKALNIRLELYGERHPDTADSYHEIGVLQHEMNNNTVALQSFQKSLDVRSKLFGEEHAGVAASYRDIGITQHEMKDYVFALESLRKALNITLKIYAAEENPEISNIVCWIDVTRHKMHEAVKLRMQSIYGNN